MTVQPSKQSNGQGRGGQTSQVHVSHSLQQCPNCGAVAGSGATVCQECGEDLTRRPKEIRCRQCHHRASAALVICPHCARELKPAPPRLLTWGVPALLILLFLAILVGRGNPLPSLRTRLDQTMSFVSGPGAGLTIPDMIAMTPAPAAEGQTATFATALDSDQPGDDGNAALALLPTATPIEEATEAPTETPTATEAPTDTPTSAPTSTPTDTPTNTPTTAPSSTPTTRATATKRATSTATADDATANAASVATDAPTKDAVAIPTRTPTRSATATSRVTSLPISTPADTPTPKAALTLPTSTPTSAAANNEPTIYTILPGDTLLGIALQFGISTVALMEANDIASDEVYAIRPGQELIIPPSDGSGSVGGLAPATSTARPTPTADADEDPPATPEPTRAAYRLDTPQLLSPESNTPVSCRGSNSLAWSSVPFILDSDKFILHLGFLSARGDAGQETVTWILNQPVPPNRTSWEMDNNLCALAPQDMGRQWRWYVEVVDESSSPVSRPSETWGFSWN